MALNINEKISWPMRKQSEQKLTRDRVRSCWFSSRIGGMGMESCQPSGVAFIFQPPTDLEGAENCPSRLLCASYFYFQSNRVCSSEKEC